jgi:hypothetical protein
MLNSLLLKVAQWSVGGKILRGVIWINDKAKGHRSEINLGVIALLWVLKKTGLIDGAALEYSDALTTALLGALPLTLKSKAERAIAAADAVVPKVEQPKP